MYLNLFLEEVVCYFDDAYMFFLFAIMAAFMRVFIRINYLLSMFSSV